MFKLDYEAQTRLSLAPVLSTVQCNKYEFGSATNTQVCHCAEKMVKIDLSKLCKL